MKLISLELTNFRGYQNPTKILFDNITALIGKNDIGKTTILDALGVFFNHKLCKFDITDKCVYAEEDADVCITCTFTEHPKNIVLDTSSITSLEDEYLLTEDGFLSISKIFKRGKGNGTYVANCFHPSNKQAKGIINKKNDELKLIANSLKIEADNRSNVSLRQAIYKNTPNLNLKNQIISLSSEDGKAIFEKIQDHFPHFALFRADRPSTDEEAEVQDPMKLAISQALDQVSHDLDRIKEEVQKSTLAVATRTLHHLAEIDAELATDLTADFKADPKWDSIFKLSLNSSNGIPVNKRGSGVRRLILISFFKAEAERIQKQAGERTVIYAIEEPETSQHPDKQRLLVDAFAEMADKPNCQVILTTHVPALAEQLPITSLRHIFRDANGDIKINKNDSEIYKLVAKDLGILPDSRSQLIICVEGPNDIEFLKGLTKALRKHDQSIPDLANDPRIIFIPLGGTTLKDWVNEHYLRNIGKPEFHIYDRDTETPPKYQESADAVNKRNDNSIAFITNKRELENYLHRDAINKGLNINIVVDDISDIPNTAANILNIKEYKAKKRLNKKAPLYMTIELLTERDPDGEVLSWFSKITELLQ